MNIICMNKLCLKYLKDNNGSQISVQHWKFNVKEKQQTLFREESGVADRNSVQQLVQILELSINVSKCNHFRFGKLNPPGTRSRPMKLTLSSEECATIFLQKSENWMKWHCQTKNFFTSDKTPNEMGYCKQVKAVKLEDVY